jgi:hypothetical protein
MLLAPASACSFRQPQSCVPVDEIVSRLKPNVIISDPHFPVPEDFADLTEDEQTEIPDRLRRESWRPSTRAPRAQTSPNMKGEK